MQLIRGLREYVWLFDRTLDMRSVGNELIVIEREREESWGVVVRDTT
jgi:hypothetical protein